MSDEWVWVFAWFAGASIGTFFFAGLWWTVSKCSTFKNPALWIIGSWGLRMASTLVVFYWVGGNDWRRLALCLLGFFMARQAILRWTRPTSGSHHAT